MDKLFSHQTFISSNFYTFVFLVKKPSELSWEVASCCLMDGVRAIDALHYLGRLRPDETLLICNAASVCFTIVSHDYSSM